MEHYKFEQMSPFVSNEAAKRLVGWMFAGDTGVSSETMVAIALNVKKQDHFGYSPPSDPSDFGRCYRLVLAVPEIIDCFQLIRCVANLVLQGGVKSAEVEDFHRSKLQRQNNCI